MLERKPKPAFWKFIKGSAKTLFVLEAVAFAVSYGVWHRMNTNSEFRKYMSENFPVVLESYYQVGELLGDNKVRQLDNVTWSHKADKKDSN
ncbi:unnamed protein product [Hermetia illucens]|uniref:Protein CEBPZOS n=1 Tax=Hermetia illucens TaxID=343691 RepID=A0A7R8UGC2_HERIL|nr:protein CEBPZOS [Hermetia illucens]CAD7080052.1 unnamed protein product [Hermetia illucens]